MIDLSIIIPAYNTAPYIRPCIDSIYQQKINEKKFEIIIVNDGSTDDTPHIIADIQKKHSNIIIITQHNQGLSITRNKGIQRAKGDYILFLDSDDMLIPDTLSYILQSAQTYQTDMTSGKHIKLNNQEIETFLSTHNPHPSITNYQIKDGETGFLENYRPQESYSVLYLYRREFLIKNKLNFIPHKYFEDVAFTINCLLKAKRFLALPILFYIYRQHNNSIMSTMNVTKLYSMNDIINNLHSLQNTLVLRHESKRKLQNSIFVCLSINLWYLSHYQSLYPYRREIIDDLKLKVPNLSFHNTCKQRFISFCIKYIPSLYLSFRYNFTHQRY